MKLKRIIAICALSGVLAGCAATYTNHGYAPSEADLAEVIVGVDTRDGLAQTLGRPSASGVLRESSWYYVASQRRHWAYRAPQEITREVVAISFDEAGVVQNIESFGLEDGKPVALSRRVTQTTIQDLGLVQQLLKNFGRIDVAETLANQ